MPHGVSGCCGPGSTVTVWCAAALQSAAVFAAEVPLTDGPLMCVPRVTARVHGEIMGATLWQIAYFAALHPPQAYGGRDVAADAGRLLLLLALATAQVPDEQHWQQRHHAPRGGSCVPGC